MYSLQCGEHIVQEENFGRRVDRSGQGDSGFLTAAQCQSFLTNLRLISSFKECKVTSKAALVDDLLVALFVIRAPEEDVLLNRKREGSEPRGFRK